MPVKATIDRKYLLRLGLTTLGVFGLALWFLYDGTVTYPRQRERALVYQGIEEEERAEKWPEIAEEHGWPIRSPGMPKEEIDIQIQLVLAAVVTVPGILCLFFFLRACGRWIEMNQTGLRTSWGRQLEFGDIILLNKKKWRSKGIAKITYRQNGRKRRLVLDDWKFATEPTREILREVESHLDASQITGGPPEALSEQEPPKADLPMEEEAT